MKLSLYLFSCAKGSSRVTPPPALPRARLAQVVALPGVREASPGSLTASWSATVTNARRRFIPARPCVVWAHVPAAEQRRSTHHSCALSREESSRPGQRCRLCGRAPLGRHHRIACC